MSAPPPRAWLLRSALSSLLAFGLALSATGLRGQALASEAASPRPEHAGPGAWAAWSAGEAARVLDDHCSDAASGAATASAQAVSAVGPVLAEVSAAHDATGLPYLLYWRGRLNLCLDREERAEEDLATFLTAAADDPAYGPQLRFARTLLRRLASPSGAPPPGAVVGVGLLGAGGALGALAVWQGQVAGQHHRDYLAGDRPWSASEALAEAARDAQRGSAVLTGLAVASGLGGVATLVAAAVASRDPAERSSSAGPPRVGPVPALVPLPDGGAFVLGGRW